jgi:two-component system chemotaxis sensor kinase CheA
VAAAAEALARRERKEVLIVRQGESVELSRSTAERLVEPISQLARNAVTHGVEPPSSRLARKKPARATLRLSAAIEVGRLRLTVEDDGGGVDIEGIGHRAVALGVLNDALRSDPAAVLATLFLPGVSTRVKADTSAGRGFGLDLVHREIAQLGGEIAVDSKRGLFTRFTIEIPLRPIAQQMLVVISAGERMAIPLDRITRVVPSPRDAGGARVFALANATGVSMLPAASASDGGAVVLVATARGPLGIGVDGVERARDFVVRPLPPLLAGMRPWSSAVLDAEGHVILVLDVDALAG